MTSVNKDLLTPGYHTGVIRLTPATGSDPLIGAPSCVRVQTWALSPDVTVGFSNHLYLPMIGR